MGTDIHGVFQRFDGSAWRDIESRYDQDRHYQLFAVLAGVRNGRGFASIPTGEAVTPIAEPRGLPDDLKTEVWMGDHSHSWLTGEEILSFAESAPEVVKTGILGRELYEAWDGQSLPAEYCGGVSGPGVVIVNDNGQEKLATPAWTHIRCHWTSGLKTELAYFFDEVARLVSEHGRVRFVFGFDS